jgi:hypothetical protein
MKTHSCIPRKGIARPQSQFPYSCFRDRFIYSQDRNTDFPAAEEADRLCEYINRSQKHECGVEIRIEAPASPFLGIFVSNFWYCVLAVWRKFSSTVERVKNNK